MTKRPEDPGDDGYDISDPVAAVRQMAEDSVAGRDRDRIRAAAKRFAALFGRHPRDEGEP
ncbi:MAG: hypothetical protein K2Y27_35115 [Xanthobacteraceae bacterium]|nr:hypothetical protein [Xanthobacteraceae bacterium]